MHISRKKFIEQLGMMGIGAAALPLVGQSITLSKVYARERFKESRYYNKLKHNMVECLRCPLHCVLSDGQSSFCKTRTNNGGVLYEDSYGNPCTINIDPIEKGPLYHVMPGIRGLAFGTAGCNLRCLYCQNWQVSQATPAAVKNIPLSADAVVNKAVENRLQSVLFTYTEPVVFFDYMMDVAEIAKKKGLLTHCCSALFVNPQPLLDLCGVIDVFTVTLKGFTDLFYRKVCGQRMNPVLDSLITLKKSGKWFEIVNLLVPTLNDNYSEIKAMTSWLVTNLGKDVPLHFTRFYPAYKLKNLPQTPQPVLENARKIALESGLRFVYIENLPGHEGNNTYCPKCSKEIIQRSGITILKSFIREGKCSFCQETIPGLWKI